MKIEDMKVGAKYSFGSKGDDSIFEVLGKYEHYLWILWVDDGDVESVYFEKPELNRIKIAV